MKSVGKYVVGGLVGAVVGFLIAPKRAQLVRDALLGRERGYSPVLQRATAVQSRLAAPAPAVSETAAPAPVALSPAAPAGGEPEVTLSEPPGSAEGVPVAEVEPVAEPEAPAAAGPTPVHTSVFWVEPQSETTAVEEAMSLERPDEADQVMTAPMGIPEEPEAPEAPEGAEGPETVEAPEMLREPVAPEALEEPEAPEAPQAPETVEAPNASVALEEPKMPEAPEAPEAPELIEAPEESILAEAPSEEPRDELGFEAEEEPALVVAEAPYEPEVVEVAGGVGALEPEVVVAAVGTSEPVQEHAAPDAVAMAEADLRGRIEETRRRIQAELERPFKLEPEVEPEPVVPAAPITVESEAFEVEEEPEPSLREGLDADRGFDYEDMRRRIEETRSRLKAKAFDAMMSGETALLARGQASETATAASAVVPVDADVDRTIESSLSEEDA